VCDGRLVGGVWREFCRQRRGEVRVWCLYAVDAVCARCMFTMGVGMCVCVCVCVYVCVCKVYVCFRRVLVVMCVFDGCWWCLGGAVCAKARRGSLMMCVLWNLCGMC